jgi:Zn-dependent peptidase ImmA (M78 family)
MTLCVPYIPDETIERDAEALLAQYARAAGFEVKAPIPIEDIVEKHLKLRIELGDLHRLLGVPRGGFGAEPGICGAIWLDTGEIYIDESLDPEERPSIEGRYRFTLAHEVGHWRLHRPLVLRNRGRGSLFGDMPRPTVVCRTTQAKERVEIQADLYASYLLMPRRLVLAEWAEWQDRVGRTRPLLVSDLCPNGRVMSRAETWFYEQGRGEVDAVNDAPMARRFGVSRTAMRIRLEKLGLLLRAEPKLQSMNL